jgi:phenylacetate-coenzyme A ligase PaaK-like adenylate-forming protein
MKAKFLYTRKISTQIREKQSNLLHHYISRVIYPFSPYYKKILDDNFIKTRHIRSIENLAKLPLTSKDDLLNTPENPLKTREFILQPDSEVLRKRPETILTALFRGKEFATNKLEREYRPIFMTSTTGRSADPIPFLYTHQDINNLASAGAQIIKLGGARKDDKILNMFPYAPHLAYWLTHYACTSMNIFCLSTGGGKVMGTDGNIKMLTKIKPSIIVGMPTFVYHVLKQAIDEGHTCKGIRTIVLGGEKVVEGTRRKLNQLAAELGSPEARVIATYGFTEAKMAWAEAPVAPGDRSTGYHLNPNLGIIEIIDPKTDEVLPPETPGEIVFTPLQARGSVVIRYRTGDFIDGGLTYSRCPVTGEYVPRLVGRISRTSEFKSMQLKKLKGTIVNFNEMDHILDDLRGIGTWQVEIRKANNDPLDVDELVVHLTLDGTQSKELIEHRIHESFQEGLEIRPNHIEFHSDEDMRKMQKVGKALKEEKFVDNRPTQVDLSPKPTKQPHTQEHK